MLPNACCRPTLQPADPVTQRELASMLHIKSVKYIADFKIWVAFDDGAEGQVDLNGQLVGPVFDPLKDKSFFSRVSVDPELETIVWPNGADLAPEFLKQLHDNQRNKEDRKRACF